MPESPQERFSGMSKMVRKTQTQTPKVPTDTISGIIRSLPNKTRPQTADARVCVAAGRIIRGMR